MFISMSSLILRVLYDNWHILERVDLSRVFATATSPLRIGLLKRIVTNQYFEGFYSVFNSLPWLKFNTPSLTEVQNSSLTL